MQIVVLLSISELMALDIYPVIHIDSEAQATEQATLALESGADGVYLIDHHNTHDTALLLSAYNSVKGTFPSGFVGLNFLQRHSSALAFRELLAAKASDVIDEYPSALWVDYADTDKEETEALRTEQPELADILYLGGVAFKYTNAYTADAEKAADEAARLAPFVDVVTTSGAGTGIAPSPEKIASMKKATSPKPLAVASGISIDNIEGYAGSFDQLLVSTSIEEEPYSGIFNEKRLKELIDKAHQL